MGDITLNQIITGGGIITGIIALITYLTKPVKEFSSRVEKLEEHSQNDNDRLKALEADSKMSLRVLNAILGHLQTGNNTGEMAKAKSDLENYIINK